MENITLMTIELIDKYFAPHERELALSLLMEECGNNLPSLEQADPTDLERVRWAAIKFSDGDIDRLLSAIELAQSDWRDLLVSVGFADDVNAHKRFAGERRFFKRVAEKMIEIFSERNRVRKT